MCLRPLTITNKGYFRLGGLPSYTCGCGTCEECQEMKSDDYFVRAWSLWKSLDPSKWSVFFCTFTFNDDNLPKASFYRAPENFDLSAEHSDNSYRNLLYSSEYLGEFPCFDHRLIHRFCKSYRQYYRRLYSRFHYEVKEHLCEGYTRKDGVYIPPFKVKRKRKVYDYINNELLPQFVITCEFGEKRHRPHYHAIIFVPRVFSGFIAFKREVEKFWKYGFTHDVSLVEKDGQTFVRSFANCFKYVLKYSCKGSSWLPPYLSDKRVFTFDLDKCDYCIRTFTSNNFGNSLSSSLTSDMLESGKLTLSLEGHIKKFNVPRYYLRNKFVYNVPLSDYIKPIEKHSLCTFLGIKKKYRSLTKFLPRVSPEYIEMRYKRIVHRLTRSYHDFTLNHPEFSFENFGVSLDAFLRYNMRNFRVSNMFFHGGKFFDYANNFKFLSFRSLMNCKFFRYDSLTHCWTITKKITNFKTCFNDLFYDFNGGFNCNIGLFMRCLDSWSAGLRSLRITQVANKKTSELTFCTLHSVVRHEY